MANSQSTIAPVAPQLNTCAEEWRPAVGWEGHYEVSNFGNVRSVFRLTKIGYGKLKKTVGKILKQQIHTTGYAVVSLSRNNKHKCVRVHALVATTFIGPRPSGLDVNHIDGNKTHNVLSNLEYATRRENNLHAFRIGLRRNDGEHHSQSRLTRSDVAEIRKLRTQGLPFKTIAEMYSISDRHARNIVQEKKWKFSNETKKEVTQ